MGVCLVGVAVGGVWCGAGERMRSPTAVVLRAGSRLDGAGLGEDPSDLGWVEATSPRGRGEGQEQGTLRLVLREAFTAGTGRRGKWDGGRPLHPRLGRGHLPRPLRCWRICDPAVRGEGRAEDPLPLAARGTSPVGTGEEAGRVLHSLPVACGGSVRLECFLECVEEGVAVVLGVLGAEVEFGAHGVEEDAALDEGEQDAACFLAVTGSC